MPRVSIIIVSWNARDYLRGCLLSLLKTAADMEIEVIVVDNASSDGSPDMVSAEFPHVILIQTGSNLGFAKANNIGIARATGEYLAFINSDVLLHEGCLQTLTSTLVSNPKVGMVGPLVLGGDGHPQISVRLFPTVWNTFCHAVLLHRLFPRIRILAGRDQQTRDYSRPHRAEVLSGCFWVARRTAVDTVGTLDERFFFYAEDVDWCRRFTDAGFALLFVPNARATHFGGGSSTEAPIRYAIQFRRANLAYWRKHHGRVGETAYRVLSILDHLVRIASRLPAYPSCLDTEARLKLTRHWQCIRWLLRGNEPGAGGKA